MKRRSDQRAKLIGVTVLLVVLLLFAVFYIGYQQSLQASTFSAETLGAQLYATAYATNSR